MEDEEELRKLAENGIWYGLSGLFILVCIAIIVWWFIRRRRVYIEPEVVVQPAYVPPPIIVG